MSGLGKMFAPEIKQGVAGLAGLLSPNGNGATSPGLDAQRAGERMDFGTASASPASVSDFDMEGAALGSAGTGSFDLGDTGGGGAVGGGGGLDSLFSDFGSSGGAGLFDVGAGGLSDLLSFSDFGSSGGGDLFGLFSDTSWFRPDEWSDVSW